ncbi:hypothetical protein K438DRAFT_1928034 [Mycena galopus ATCC 62051]|nr:hypothetical protein K438DRAFT_1928034 [Mycena galopus ATCC 62051]
MSQALTLKGLNALEVTQSLKTLNSQTGSHPQCPLGSTTNFWDPEIFPADPEGKGEITQGKNLVDVAKEVGIKFFILSSLPSATKGSNGAFKHVYHVDNIDLPYHTRLADKAEIEEYLKASGVPYAALHTGWFAENLWKIGSLSKTDSGNFVIPIPKFGPDDMQSCTWVAHDLGQAAVALLTNYTDPSKGVLGRSYPVVSLKFTYPELAAAIAKAIKKEVKFTPIETAGLVEIDEMFQFQARFGMYNDTSFPNPDLVALGVKFATLEDFLQTEIVPRFA